MKKLSVTISVLIVLLLGACASLPGLGGDDLTGTTWTLESYGGMTPLQNSSMTAEFEGGQVSGSASCNLYFAEYRTQGDQISFEGLGWTEMACMDPEGIMEQEQAIMLMLGSAASYQIEGDRLVISTTAAEQLVFTRK